MISLHSKMLSKPMSSRSATCAPATRRNRSKVVCVLAAPNAPLAHSGPASSVGSRRSAPQAALLGACSAVSNGDHDGDPIPIGRKPQKVKNFGIGESADGMDVGMDPIPALSGLAGARGRRTFQTAAL